MTAPFLISIIQLAGTCSIAAFAGLVHGAVGIGFPLIATPFLAMVTDVQTAVVLLVIPTVSLNLLNIMQGGKWADSILRYWPLAVYGMVGSAMGSLILVRISPDIFRPLLACVLICYLNLDRIGIRMGWISRHPKTAAAVFGLAAGLLGGTVNVMLPALVVFALEIKMGKTAMIQVFNLCFLTGKLTQGGVLALSGCMTQAVVLKSIPLALTAVIVSLTGMGFRDKIPGDTYRKWLRILLFAMAIVLLVQSASEVIPRVFATT